MKLPKIPEGWEKDMKSLPLVEVVWWDTTTLHGWREWNEVKEHDPIEVSTVGYLLPPAKNLIRMISSMGDNGTFGYTWLIPSTWVKSVKTLKR
jgi:hypothetical protein